MTFLDSATATPLMPIPEESSMSQSVILDPEMRRIFSLIRRLGQSSIPILLLGETGAGKEVVADWVHRSSHLGARPLLKINCAGLSESVVDSELFGHERGAFTGAVQASRGLFECADGGTLFLDELAELPLRTQAKLLRVLETGEFCRLGSTQQRKSSIRLIAATHRDLPGLIERGEFRRDLYFRLNGATIVIPPLRERPLEIVPLARHFLRRASRLLGGAERLLDASAERALTEYLWPGNVRELRNVIDCAAALSSEGLIGAPLLTLGRPLHSAPPCLASGILGGGAFRGNPTDSAVASGVALLRGEIQSFERAQIVSALEHSHGNQTQAAKLLGISRRTLTNKLNAYGIERPRKARAPSETRLLILPHAPRRLPPPAGEVDG
jgi:transcriptional regulator with GAF, ATPase, and Fis domain